VFCAALAYLAGLIVEGFVRALGKLVLGLAR
jgi:hypothetical protein